MAHLIERPNALQPHGRIMAELPPGLTVRQALRHVHPGFEEFPMPTLVTLNGRPVMRSAWDSETVAEGDVLAAAALPSGIETAFYVFIALVAVATYVMVSNMPKPKTPAELPTLDPAFTLSGQRNIMKIMEPIEVAYGRNRLWPSYASRPFNKYQDNDQYLYQLFCLGQGEYDVHGVYIEDTPIGDFDNVQYELVPPGGELTLFPGNVVTSVEVSRLELFGTNSPEYTTYGPFVVNPAFTQTGLLEVDVSLPGGLYRVNGDGDFADRNARATFQYRRIDDNGAPMGDWATLANFYQFKATVNPLRFTLSKAVPWGRYEVRGWRTNDQIVNGKGQDTIIWEAARAFLRNTTAYGNVTMLAVAAQATNNLNDGSSNRINVDCTRKLPVRLGGNWTAPIATRSIAWAFYDIFSSAYGGQLESAFIDLDELERLDAVWEGRQEYFDHVFNQKATVWDAAKTVARVGRAVPVVSGSFVSLVRDEVQSVPRGVFNAENILPDSFKWEVKLLDPKEHDSVEVTYVNRTTGLQEVVSCLPPGSLGLNPEKITLAGCTDRNHAYHEGMYIAMSDQLLRENISFKTGLEGYLPSYGDMVVVSYPLPRWGTAGFVESADGRVLRLSEPVSFRAGMQHYLMLRRDDGTGDGPYLVAAGVDPFTVVLESSLSQGFDFSAVGREPVLFTFGPVDEWSRKCRVVEINPSGDEAVELVCVNYDPAVFQFDEANAPAIALGAVPPKVPARPVVPYLQVSRVPTSLDYVVVGWGPALGAKSYVLQMSRDGSDWETVIQTQGVTHQLQVLRGPLHLRVAAINVGRGPWVTWDGDVGSPTEVPLDVQGLSLQAPFDGVFAKIQWASLVDADTYTVRVYKDAGATLLRTATVSGVEFTYNYDMLKLDTASPSRSLRFSVVGTNEYGESEVPAVLDAYNPPPAQMTSGFYSRVKVQDADSAVYTLSWLPSIGADIRGYRVWASTVSGFTADASTLKFDGIGYECDVTVDKVPLAVQVTGISKANPGVVSYTGPTLANGKKVVLSGVGGMTYLNGRTFVVRGASGSTFQLYEEVSAEYTTTEQAVDTNYPGAPAYTSGGTATVMPAELVRQALYWKVAALDLWGDDVTPSAERTAS